MDKAESFINFKDLVNGIGGRNTDQFLFFDSKDISNIITHEGTFRLNCPAMIVHCISGKGYTVINSKRYKIDSGCFCCIFQGDTISMHKKVNDRSHFIIMVCNNADFMYSLNNTLSLFETKKRIEQCNCFHLNRTIEGYYRSIYALMNKTAMMKDLPCKDQIIQNYLRILYLYSSVEFSNGQFVEPSGIGIRGEELLNHFTQLVAAHYMDNRQIQFYADKLCITPKHLSTSIRNCSGRYAKEIIAEFVIAEAKKSLLSTSASIQQISDNLHFANQSFFGKYFRHHTGLSPIEYRSNNQKSTIS